MLKIDFERSGKGQEPSRGHKFSILENFLSIRDFTSQTLASFPSDLVGACLPQTLLIIRALRHEWNGVSCLHKATVFATLQANAERKPKVQSKQDTIGKLIDIQSRMTEGKGIGYKRWLPKHNLKVMAQTVNLLQEKGLTNEDALNQRIAELETKYHDSLAVAKDLEGRMKANKELRYHIAAYTSTKSVTQQLKCYLLSSAQRPVSTGHLRVVSGLLHRPPFGVIFPPFRVIFKKRPYNFPVLYF